MKKLSLDFKIAIVALLVSGAALAAAFNGPFAGIDTLPRFSKGGLYIGSGSVASTTNKIANSFGTCATVDFTSSRAGVALSSAITLTGVAVGDTCFVGTPAAAGALLAGYEAKVTAANEVKISFSPESEISGTCTLGGESPSVCPAQTVVASSVCTCSPVGTSAALAAAGCAVSLSGTTLTITSLNGGTHVVNYDCKAPIDPASSSFCVRCFSPT